ncbi:hypothetical protein PSTT_14526 [Puccinia striiformis]|uniref:Uncharacterized protein n=1 Tax=Puccinia striiformis TaxID=27350 RepID=A0A2S4ULU5_9BASI|nr:hypothetical protein PSTT_14526 [Puccinia striiformis]
MPTKVLCTCVSRGCGNTKHADEAGLIRAGRPVTHVVREAHLLWDERNRSMVQAVAEITSRHHPDIGTITRTTTGNSPLESFGSLSCFQPNLLSPNEVQSNTSLSRNGLQPDSTPDGIQTNQGHQDGQPIEFDCSPLFSQRFLHQPASIILVNLKTALFYLTTQLSRPAARCLLNVDRQLFEMAASNGLVAPSETANHEQALPFPRALDSIPQDPRTIIASLGIEVELDSLICCSRCFAMYPDNSSAPTHCVHRHHRLPELSEDALVQLDDQVEELQAGGPLPEDLAPFVCNAELFCDSDHHPRRPIRKFATLSLNIWLARLFSRAGIEDALDATASRSSSPYDAAASMSDIHDSRVWKEFCGPDGQQFTAKANNVVFAMFMDGINPYGNRQAGKHVSVTFIIMVCLSLPVSLRYRPENIYLVGIAPGPQRTMLEQVNAILRPVVEQLKALWNPGLYLSKTYQRANGRLVSAALMPFFGDLPAVRRALGFAFPTATRMCSYCLLKKQDIKNTDRSSWPMRKLEDHQYWAKQSRDAPDAKSQAKILLDHGVRYSVLLELSYWNILEYHVVDSMHNLLLGLLKWHTQRFWLMSDVDDEPEPRGVSARELNALSADQDSPLPSNLPAGRRHTTPFDSDDNGLPFADLLFGSITDSSDAEFVLHDDWDGQWVPPSEGKIIFDRATLSYINQRLKRIHIPTWIKRAIPALGKASFGRLKADEWRNLFTIQLPLLLPVLWNDGDPGSQSLIHNFAHLVSLVLLALKRVINKEQIDRYHHHLSKYIESSLVLFPDAPLAPNHHMVFHLAECLERFGPCRAWWSFSMERMMATVLKSTTNNRIGQLEITCTKNFYVIANLRALLESPSFPPALHPFIQQLKSFQCLMAFLRPMAETKPEGSAQVCPCQLKSQPTRESDV